MTKSNPDNTIYTGSLLDALADRDAQRPGAQAASEPVASDEFIKQFGNGKPLRYSLDDYWTAPGSGPLHATWMDKPHRLIYDLVAAVRFYAAPAGERPAQAEPMTDEILVLLTAHDGDDSPAVALARNHAELLEQVKVAVWGEPHPADTTNDAGDDMAEGITNTLLETGAMHFEGDPPLRLVRIPVESWFSARERPGAQAPSTADLLTTALQLLDKITNVRHVNSADRYTAEKELIRVLHRLAAPSTGGAETERGAFETWAAEQGFPLGRLDIGDGESYRDLRSQGVWDAWQARAVLQSPAASPASKEDGNG